MSRSIRSRLDRLERQAEEQPVTPPDWDALGRGDNERFLASLPEGYPPPPDAETIRERQRRADLCRALNCTPEDLGMFWGPDYAPCRPPFAQPPAPKQPPSSGFVEVPPTPEGEQKA